MSYADNFKIRCSSIGKIMTNDRSGKRMGKTAQSYCDQWLKEQIYQRSYEFTSKYTNKGDSVEQESIDFAASVLGWGMTFKNEQTAQNDFMTGTADIVTPWIIRDMKNSWDCFTFPLFDYAPTSDNILQVHGYMELYGTSKAEVVYTLMNTPAEIAEREIHRMNGYDEDLSQDDFEKLMRRFVYDDIDPKYRIRVFEFDKDPTIIEAIQVRVNECREYIRGVEKKMANKNFK